MKKKIQKDNRSSNIFYFLILFIVIALYRRFKGVDTIPPTITNYLVNSINHDSTALGTVTANETVSWSVGTNDDGSYVQVNNLGVVSLRAPSDYKTKQSYTFKIIATDNFNNTISVTQTVNVSNPFTALTQDKPGDSRIGGIYWAVKEYFSTDPDGTKFKSGGEYEEKFGPIEYWNTSNITVMSYLFVGETSFNSNISVWDVSNVTNMNGMFKGARAFNQPIGSWDVSNVTNMYRMFLEAEAFNQPIGDWNVSNVNNMDHMFRGATAFNQPINTQQVTVNNNTYTAWDVSNVTDMIHMFYEARAFNQPIGSWDVSNVTNMNGMFYEARAFNQPIGSWDVSRVTDMTYMFYGATAFNQPINTQQVTVNNNTYTAWDVSNVTIMRDMFAGATFFNQPIGSWKVSKVNDMGYMFNVAKAFNQNINKWEVAEGTNLSNMFQNSGITQGTYGFDVPTPKRDQFNQVNIEITYDPVADPVSSSTPWYVFVAYGLWFYFIIYKNSKNKNIEIEQKWGM